jgi:hypothetical protein
LLRCTRLWTRAAIRATSNSSWPGNWSHAFRRRLTPERAQRDFATRFQQGAIPENLDEQLMLIEGSSARLTGLLKDLGFVASGSEASRKIQILESLSPDLCRRGSLFKNLNR